MGVVVRGAHTKSCFVLNCDNKAASCGGDIRNNVTSSSPVSDESFWCVTIAESGTFTLMEEK